MAYLLANDFNHVMTYFDNTFTECSLITLPELTHEGRTVKAMKIGKPSATINKRAVLFIGGCHARELVNPDLLMTFAWKLLIAYRFNNGLVFGPVTYDALTVRLIIEAIDIYILPLVNPDGRAHEQSTHVMWRKNRNPNTGLTCAYMNDNTVGVDINRNYDFLWSSGIGTSNEACGDVYKGSAAFSEPETRNVRYLLDTYPKIEAMIDLHSYSELILYPWGDDQSQTTDPNMNFQNPAFNGQRGFNNDTYKEYIPQADLDRFLDLGYRMRNKISEVRGHCYTVQTGFQLYPTSGTSDDYAYSRHLVDATKGKIFAFVVETVPKPQFQPPAAEADQVITEVSAGLFEFCIAICCPIMSASQNRADCTTVMTGMNLFNDQVLMKTDGGKYYQGIAAEYLLDVRELTQSNKKAFSAVVRLVRSLDQVAALHYTDEPKALPAKLIQNIDRSLATLATSRGMDDKFKKVVQQIRAELPSFEGKTLVQALKERGRKSG